MLYELTIFAWERCYFRDYKTEVFGVIIWPTLEQRANNNFPVCAEGRRQICVVCPVWRWWRPLARTTAINRCWTSTATTTPSANVSHLTSAQSLLSYDHPTVTQWPFTSGASRVPFPQIHATYKKTLSSGVFRRGPPWCES